MKRDWVRIAMLITSAVLLLSAIGLVVYYYTHQGSGKAAGEIQYERVLDYNDLVGDAHLGKIQWIIRQANLADATLENLFVKYDDNKVYLVQIKVGSEAWSGLDEWARGLEIRIRPEEAIPGIQWKQQLPSIIIGLLLVLVIGFGSWWALTRGPLAGWGSKFLKIKSRQEFRKKVAFDDVAGVDEPKEEVSEVISFIQDPAQFEAAGANMPHGVLFVGPPGVGKTLLARAAACEAKVPYREISGSGLHEMFVGVGPSRFREYIGWLIKNAPAVGIVDEIDSAGVTRFQGVFHDESANLTNEILHSLDTLEKESIPVIIFGITNRPDMLDPALLRPGRFDRHIEFFLPDDEGRKDILQVHFTRPKIRPIDPDLDLDRIVRETRGFSGAGLAMLVNEAAIRAARRMKTLSPGEKIVVIRDDFDEAILRVLEGPKKRRNYRPIEKEILAWHEAGHVIAAKLLPETDEVGFVTVLSRGRAGGFTRLLPLEEVNIYTQTQIFNQIKVYLAGRAAEEIHFGKFSTSAWGDLNVANSLAKNAVCVYGMSKLGPIYVNVPETSGYSFWSSPVWQGEMGKLAALEIKDVAQENYNEALGLLNANRKKLTVLAQELSKRLFIPGDEIDAIINNT